MNGAVLTWIIHQAHSPREAIYTLSRLPTAHEWSGLTCRRREPVEGSGVSDHRTVEGKHSETSNSGVCNRNCNG
jgi:hypothetical protein